MKLKKLFGFILAFAMMIPTNLISLAADETDQFECKILYTNDVHSYINETLSYATVSQMKKDLAANGENVLLVDAGDHIQGTAYGALDKGKTIIELMNEADYDVATFGNHEFDYGMARALNLTSEADFPYVSCNFMDLTTDDTVVDPYYVEEIDGVKIAFVGVTTPETITSSTPAYFMNEDQTEYIYGVEGGEDGTALYAAVQNAVDAANAEADYVIVLGHCGDDPSAAPWRSEDVIANVSGIDAWIDGHSHSTVPMKEVTDKDGDTVVLTQTGSYYKAIGQMTISGDKITTELITSYEGSDEEVAATQSAWIQEVEDSLGTQIGESDQSFYIYDPADGTRLVRSSETNLGDLNADAIYYLFNETEGLDCDVAFMNGGGVRADVTDSTWTYLTCKTVNPFGNVMCLMEVTGQTILDALEFGARFVGEGENGGFLQVAGLTYDINTSIPNTVQLGENNVWAGGPTGEYRVTNVQVYDKASGSYQPLDLTKTYTLAGANYTLRNAGDGFTMFKDAVLVKDYVSQDYLCFANYIMNFADTDGDGIPNIASENSPLAAYANYKIDYSTVAGSGRINIVDGTEVVEEPEETTTDETTTEETTTVDGTTTVIPNTGLYADPAYLAIGGAAMLAAFALISKKRRA